MLFTNHVLTGALIGRVTRRPGPAFALGVASHAAMDVVPHWGSDDDADFLRVARRDGLVAAALGVAALALAPPPSRRAVVAGMAGAAVLDMDKPQRHFLGRSYFPTVIDHWHERIQRGREAPHRMPFDVTAAAVLAAVLALSFRRR